MEKEAEKRIRDRRSRSTVYAYLTTFKVRPTKTLGMYGMDFCVVDMGDTNFFKSEFKRVVGIVPLHMFDEAVPDIKRLSHSESYSVLHKLYAEKEGQVNVRHGEIVQSFVDMGYKVLPGHDALSKLLSMQQQLYSLSKR
jgi:hypothetical protein